MEEQVLFSIFLLRVSPGRNAIFSVYRAGCLFRLSLA